MNPFQQQGPPVFDENLPMEAQAIIAQPEALKALRDLKGFQLASVFYFQMPFMLKPSFSTKLQKNMKSLVKYCSLSILAGTMINFQIKKVHMNFLKWPIFIKVPIRLGVMAIPFGFTYSLITNKMDEIIGVVEELEKEKDVLIKNRNLYEYFGIPKTKKK